MIALKKVISVIISLIIAVCSLSMISVTASAAFVGSVETTTKEFGADVTVNGKPSIDGKYEIVDPSEGKDFNVRVEFTYSGEEPLQYWEVLGLKEGVDYVIISDADGKLVIGIINNDINYVVANAVTAVDSEKTTLKINKDRKSPDTGADLTAVAISASAALGAVAAVTAKKKSK